MQLEPAINSSNVSSLPSFGLTESAAARINKLKIDEGKPHLRLRISVKGGGCSGFQYEFSLDDAPPTEQDFIAKKNHAEVLVDDVSLAIVQGSVLDYAEDLSSAGFEVKNPNAASRCGCGNSFSVAL